MSRLRNGKRRLHYVALPAGKNKRAKRSGAIAGNKAGGAGGGGIEGVEGGRGGGGGSMIGGMIGGGKGVTVIPPSTLSLCRGGERGKGKGKGKGKGTEGLKSATGRTARVLGMMTATEAATAATATTAAAAVATAAAAPGEMTNASCSDPAAFRLEGLGVNVLSVVIGFLRAQETEALTATCKVLRRETDYRSYVKTCRLFLPFFPSLPSPPPLLLLLLLLWHLFTFFS
ncbi:Hypothetical protein NocV09_12800010 [Nannochloropsis oceanica]